MNALQDKPSTRPRPRRSGTEIAVASWAVLGFSAIIVRAIVALTPMAVDAFEVPDALGGLHWAFLAVWLPWMAWSEGYRGFQLRLTPRLVGRAWHVASHRRPLHVALAPLFAVGYFHADRRTLISRYLLTFMIVGAVLLVRLLDQPWRGLVDAGVVLGLLWGVTSILWVYGRSLVAPDRTPPPLGLPASE